MYHEDEEKDIEGGALGFEDDGFEADLLDDFDVLEVSEIEGEDPLHLHAAEAEEDDLFDFYGDEEDKDGMY